MVSVVTTSWSILQVHTTQFNLMGKPREATSEACGSSPSRRSAYSTIERRTKETCHAGNNM